MINVLERESAAANASANQGQTIITLLNRQVANWSILYMKLHQHHWFVKGPGFFDLHAKFQEFYNEADSIIDMVAERILMLNGSPVSTTQEIAKTASIKEHAPLASAQAMVQSLSSDYKQIISELKEAMKAAEQQGDQGTSDMLLGICGSLEKHVWMLDAYLK